MHAITISMKWNISAAFDLCYWHAQTHIAWYKGVYIMSATCCPFDGDLCEKKQRRFDAWQKVIVQNDSMVFQLNPDMFADCVIDSAEEREKVCDRYKRYLFIIQKTSQENHK